MVGVFTGLYFPQNVVDSSFCQGIVPESGIIEHFDFVGTFASSDEAKNKILHLHDYNSWQG
jgi:hypothetical protein